MNKTILAITSVLSILAASSVYFNQDGTHIIEQQAIPSEVVAAFNSWKASQNRLYSTPSEQNHRLSVFYQNYKLVAEVNSQKLSYTFGLNSMSDLSHDEFAARFLQKPTEVQLSGEMPEENFEQSSGFGGSQLQQGPPDFKFSWCDQNYCSAVQTQGNRCASGYAFATAKTIEYPNNIARRSSSLPLSAQELIDCSVSYGNNGCNGGLVSNSISYARINGLNYSLRYPYTDTFNSCNTRVAPSYQFRPANFFSVNQDVNSFVNVIKKTPFSVGINATTMQNYQGGIFLGNGCGTSITHFMTLVGYGMQNSNSYWILENCWGTAWGQRGYMYLSANNGSTQNVCGVLGLGVANVLTN